MDLFLQLSKLGFTFIGSLLEVERLNQFPGLEMSEWVPPVWKEHSIPVELSCLELPFVPAAALELTAVIMQFFFKVEPVADELALFPNDEA